MKSKEKKIYLRMKEYDLNKHFQRVEYETGIYWKDKNNKVVAFAKKNKKRKEDQEM